MCLQVTGCLFIFNKMGPLCSAAVIFLSQCWSPCPASAPKVEKGALSEQALWVENSDSPSCQGYKSQSLSILVTQEVYILKQNNTCMCIFIVCCIWGGCLFLGRGLFVDWMFDFKGFFCLLPVTCRTQGSLLYMCFPFWIMTCLLICSGFLNFASGLLSRFVQQLIGSLPS